jgi:hypothetical protein
VYLGGEVWFITHFSFRKVPTQLGRFHRWKTDLLLLPTDSNCVQKHIQV